MIKEHELIKKMKSGDRLALARIISKIENRDSDSALLISQIYSKTGRAQVWGITGPPGAGKSTLVDALTRQLRANGKTVAIVAVDPSSPFTGGAVLGDRIRMQAHFQDKGVFIRSLGTRGQHGGLSLATRDVTLVLDAAGFDFVLVETAGVGQTDLDISRLAQTVVVVLVPESGDSIQVMKAGLMEIADIFVVNKSDRPSADQMVKELTQMLTLKPHDTQTWMGAVVKTEAHRQVGISEVLSAIAKHAEHLSQSGDLSKRLRVFLTGQVVDIVLERSLRDIELKMNQGNVQKEFERVVVRELDPYAFVEKIYSERVTQ